MVESWFVGTRFLGLKIFLGFEIYFRVGCGGNTTHCGFVRDEKDNCERRGTRRNCERRGREGVRLADMKKSKSLVGLEGYIPPIA